MPVGQLAPGEYTILITSAAAKWQTKFLKLAAY
jgi:hypothetical protein